MRIVGFREAGSTVVRRVSRLLTRPLRLLFHYATFSGHNSKGLISGCVGIDYKDENLDYCRGKSGLVSVRISRAARRASPARSGRAACGSTADKLAIMR